MAYRLKNNLWTLQTNQGEQTLSDIAARHAQPFYLYDLENALARARRFLQSGFAPHFAMKANSYPRLLRELAALGFGVDVVSLGELQKALRSGFKPGKVIFSGVAKDRDELEAALNHGIFQINVESFEELRLLQQICAEKHKTADIALRLNIHLAAPTHHHVQTATPESKFGIDLENLPEVLDWLRGKKEIRLKALATHIGSQIEDLGVFRQMAVRMGELYREIKGIERLDLGGGLGIDYQTAGEDDEDRIENYLAALRDAHNTDAKILVEPGRILVARMGALMARVVYVKKTSTQTFAILNAGMNCLMRPALYQAFHRITPVVIRPGRERYTVVGPICESTDKFAQDREMSPLERGDWVAVFDTGAYGATMANTYNESPLPEQWSLLNGIWET